MYYYPPVLQIIVNNVVPTGNLGNLRQLQLQMNLFWGVFFVPFIVIYLCILSFHYRKPTEEQILFFSLSWGICIQVTIAYTNTFTLP